MTSAKRVLSVRAVAATLGCDWHTVNDAVIAYGEALIDKDVKRIKATTAVGLDETSFKKNRLGITHYATTVCDVKNRQVIDVLPGRNHEEVGKFFGVVDPTWRNGITDSVMDISATYRRVFKDVFPHATHIADHFHVIQRANQALDEVRRRVQQETCGHRGRRHDPLFQIRRSLVKATERLSPKTAKRLDTALRLGDPNGEVAVAYRIKEELRLNYAISGLDSCPHFALLCRFLSSAVHTRI